MRITFCAVLVLGFMAMMGTASALEPVTLTPAACSFWSNGATGFNTIPVGLWTGANAIWDAVGFLNWNGSAMEPGDIPGFPLTWAASDMEGMVGDGLSDRLQLALLAANLCNDPSGNVAVQYANNLEAFGGLIAKFYALIAAVTDPIDLPTRLNADGISLAAFANTLPVPPYGTIKAQLLALAAAMDDPNAGASALLAGFATKFGMYVPIFEGLGPWFVGMAGTSAAMDDTMNDLMFNVDYGIVKDLAPAGAGLAALAGYLHGTAAQLGGFGQPALAALLQGDANALDALVAIIGTIGWPVIEIYGVSGKTDIEPFSGPGDYDGNGDTNADVAAKVGSDPAAFVAAASGAAPFYAGNPNLPVVGLFGLSLLASACAAAGAFVIRKK